MLALPPWQALLRKGGPLLRALRRFLAPLDFFSQQCPTLLLSVPSAIVLLSLLLVASIVSLIQAVRRPIPVFSMKKSKNSNRKAAHGGSAKNTRYAFHRSRMSSIIRICLTIYIACCGGCLIHHSFILRKLSSKQGVSLFSSDHHFSSKKGPKHSVGSSATKTTGSLSNSAFARRVAELENTVDADSFTTPPDSIYLGESADRQFASKGVSFEKPATCTADFVREKEQSVALIRILGNDLPPRHSPNQTLTNVEFILENEPAFPNVHKHWLLNRIQDPVTLSRILKLLDEYLQSYSIIHFDEDVAYSIAEHMAYDTSAPLESFYQIGNSLRRYVLQQMYHPLSLYVMNNNGARNAAIRIGKAAGFHWVLPFDGNIFVTPQAWKGIEHAVRSAASEHHKYVIIPMARLLDNDVVMQPGWMPDDMDEEPQIGVRCDANLEFDENMRYGRIPKVEMLRRLGVHGPWDGIKKLDWESDQNCAPGLQRINQTCWSEKEFKSLNDTENWTQMEKPESWVRDGHVLRLFSGTSQAQESTVTTETGEWGAAGAPPSARHSARMEAILSYLDSTTARKTTKQWANSVGIPLNDVLAGNLLTYYNETLLRKARVSQEKNDLVKDVIRVAKSALMMPSYSIRFDAAGSGARLCEGSAADYCSRAPPQSGYALQEAQRQSLAMGLGAAIAPGVAPSWAELSLDPVDNKGQTHTHSHQGEDADRAMLYATVLNSTVLALASEVSEDESYAKYGGQVVRKFFIDKASSMRPHLKYSHTRQNKDGSLKVLYGGYVDTTCLILAVDAWRLLQRNGGLSSSDISSLRAWAGDFLRYLFEVEPLQLGHHAASFHGLAWDAQVAALATFVGDMSTAVRVLRRVPLRVMQADADDGPFPSALHLKSGSGSSKKSAPANLSPDICFKLHLLGVLGQVITVYMSA